MPTKIYSFGFKHRKPTGRVVDVRNFVPYNPYSVASLRALTGQDPNVIDWFWNHPVTPSILERRLQGVWKCIEHETGDVYLGCTGGKHRSVFVADYLGRLYMIPVEHLDSDKP